MKPKLILIPFVLLLVSCLGLASVALAQSAAPSSGKKPNILILWGDDIGYWNVVSRSVSDTLVDVPSSQGLDVDGHARICRNPGAGSGHGKDEAKP